MRGISLSAARRLKSKEQGAWSIERRPWRRSSQEIADCEFRIADFGSGQPKLSFSFLLSQFRNPKFQFENASSDHFIRPVQHRLRNRQADLFAVSD